MSSSLKQVLVHLDATQGVQHRLAAARHIAQEHGAALGGLYAATPVFMELPYAPEMIPTLAAELVQVEEERRRRCRELFDQAMTGPGPLAAWSQTSEVPITAAFSQQALFADLLVLGQHDPSDPAAAAVPPDFPESVLIASGRPALVVPRVGWSGTIGWNIAIAWKETPEAVRALVAALPLLQRAGRVHVLTWDDEAPPAIEGTRLELDGYLRLHGVQATWHRGGPEPDALADLLLSRCFDLEADLLVMGCYGHGRAREWILGGVTRSVLRSMTLPVLMAH